MLSTPLADDFAVPASLPPFLLKLIKIMVERPCGDMIRPLYQVLGGIQPLLLEVLPDESMEHFQTECTKVLRGLDDHIGNLLCLATLARIASAASTTSTTSSSSPPSISDLEWSAPKPRTWQQNVFQFFNAMRGSKTLDIVVLRVILASSGSSDLSLGASIEGLKLAKEILEVVEPDQRKAWVKAHAAKVAKLLGKIQQPGLPPALQAAVCAVVLNLVKSNCAIGHCFSCITVGRRQDSFPNLESNSQIDPVAWQGGDIESGVRPAEHLSHREDRCELAENLAA